MNKKKIIFITIPVFIVVALLIVAILTTAKGTGCGRVYDHATDFDLEIGSSLPLDDGWMVRKIDKGGVIVLDIWNPGIKTDSKAKNYFYYVYDSEGEAKKAYKQSLENYKEYNSYFEEGDSWFVSEDPYACDARVVFMHYLEENVIIICEVEVWGEAAEPVDGPSPNSYTDNKNLKDYCINNSSKLRKYVIEEVLGLD